jgi:hypothetical protein
MYKVHLRLEVNFTKNFHTSFMLMDSLKVQVYMSLSYKHIEFL